MEDAIVLTYDISADDFTRAGEASSDVKRKLKQMGVDPEAIRKVAIAMYEGEINMVIHAKGGLITVEMTPQQIKMILADVGLGFGAGMGLPNMKKYSDEMEIDTRLGEGTTITMIVKI